MAGRDGTGPLGQGAMTGRGLGVCQGLNSGIYGAGRGLGMGLGRGLGRGVRGIGLCRGYSSPVSAPGIADGNILKAQKAILETQLAAIRSQLDNLHEDNK